MSCIAIDRKYGDCSSYCRSKRYTFASHEQPRLSPPTRDDYTSLHPPASVFLFCRRHLHWSHRSQNRLRVACGACSQTSASQVTLLNEELRSRNKELERASKRSGANLEYLKNMVVAWMEEDSQDQVFQVIATILQFSPEETARIKEKRKPQGFRVC
jgi:hypothetical protein